MVETRRVRMTKKMMKDAMLELLEKKNLEKITVTDICEKADVNRSTFYSYYEDIVKLLIEIENDVLNQLPVTPDIPTSYSDERFLIALEDFFNYVRENKKLFRTLIIQHDNSSFNQRLIEAVIEKYRPSEQNSDNLTGRYSYIYCVNGVIGILKEWINTDFPVSTRKFAEIVLLISSKVTS